MDFVIVLCIYSKWHCSRADSYTIKISVAHRFALRLFALQRAMNCDPLFTSFGYLVIVSGSIVQNKVI